MKSKSIITSFATILLLLFSITAKSIDLNLSGSGITISAPGDYTITGSSSESLNITDNNGGGVFNITLNNINITASEWGSAFNIINKGSTATTVNITLIGDNISKGGNHGGMKFPSESTGDINVIFTTTSLGGTMDFSAIYCNAFQNESSGNVSISVADDVCGSTATLNGTSMNIYEAFSKAYDQKPLVLNLSKITTTSLASVITSSISYTDITATVKGNVTCDGLQTVTERGIVYSTSNTAPTIEGSNTTKIISGSGMGIFSIPMNGLSPQTTYYVSSYAINASGTRYSDVSNFTTTPVPTAPSAGDGTSGNPYQIASLENLFWLSQTSSAWASYFIQTADIDVSTSNTWDGGNGFSPIGNDGTYFTGNYNGEGHTITGLYISRSSTVNIGLFGYTSSATITNLGLIGGSVNGTETTYVGGLIGHAVSSSISNCYASSSANGQYYVGGLIGANYGSTISNCYATGSASGNGNGNGSIGGLMGGSGDGGIISNCYATGTVNGSNSVEGLIGDNWGNSISNCFYNTDIFTGSTSAGTGKTTAELQTASTFTDASWSTSVWSLLDGSYPKLVWQLTKPTVTTTAITTFDATSASMGGNVTDDGGTTVTERGVVYSSTDATPTIGETGVTKDANGTGTGSFSKSITGLSGNTIYYVRAFATNTADTSYGDIQSFNTAILTVTWNGTWSPSAPTSNDDAVLDADYSAAGFNCNNLTINAGKQLTVSSDITVNKNLTLKSDANGIATIVDDNKVGVLGTTTVEQYLTTGRNWYISSPVGNATSATIINEVGSKLWKYNETTPAWDEIISNSTMLNEMVGYVVNKASDGVVSFTGDWYNDGQITINQLSRTGTSDSKRGFNLIGNPYPSCVNWKQAVDDKLTSNLDPTIWYRGKNATAYVFDTYNAFDNVGTHNYGGANVTGIIPPMQAVWVRVNADNVEGSVTFNNSMRSHPTTGNKLKADANTNDIVRLQVANGNSSDETILVFNANASNAYDAYDSQKMFAESADVPQIYSTADAEKVVINGLQSVATNSIIPLGFKTATAGTFTISATEINGVDAVVLEDKLLNKTQDLTGSASYTFTSDNVDNTSRFAIRLKANSVTDVPDILKSTIAIVAQNHSIVVTTSETSGTINVYDLLGRIVETKAIEGTKTVLESPVGVYFVKVQTATDIETKKIIIE